MKFFLNTFYVAFKSVKDRKNKARESFVIVFGIYCLFLSFPLIGILIDGTRQYNIPIEYFKILLSIVIGSIIVLSVSNLNKFAKKNLSNNEELEALFKTTTVFKARLIVGFLVLMIFVYLFILFSFVVRG